MDYVIVAISILSGLAFHLWLFVRLRRWMDRDLALSLAGNNPDKRGWMLQQLQEAQRCKIPHTELPKWLADREKAFVVPVQNKP